MFEILIIGLLFIMSLVFLTTMVDFVMMSIMVLRKVLTKLLGENPQD